MSENNTIKEYVASNYSKMFREPSGNLKYKYIVPGSVYAYTLWDWDCWLTNIALKQYVTDDISAYEEGCVLNFLEHIDEEGRVPIVIMPDKTMPEVLGSGSNIHKPCLAQHAAFIIKSKNDNAEWLRPHFDKLRRFVDYYMNNCRHKVGLYFWNDDLAVGVDNDPCTFYRPNKSSGSIYLNCLMYKELEAICYIGKLLNDDVEKYELEKECLKKNVQEHCFDERDSFYYSVDLNLLPVDLSQELHSGAPREWECLIQRIGVWSGFLAMWSGIATAEQAERMVNKMLLDKEAFWAPYGVRTLAKYEKMYTIKATGNPSCWLGPIWGIVNYLVFRGLVKYGYNDIASQLAHKTIDMFEKDILQCGQMHEYYDPESGKPIINPGFQNWNLLAINMQAWLNGETVVEEF